MPKNKNYKI